MAKKNLHGVGLSEPKHMERLVGNGISDRIDNREHSVQVADARN